MSVILLALSSLLATGDRKVACHFYKLDSRINHHSLSAIEERVLDSSEKC